MDEWMDEWMDSRIQSRIKKAVVILCESADFLPVVLNPYSFALPQPDIGKEEFPQ